MHIDVSLTMRVLLRTYVRVCVRACVRAVQAEMAEFFGVDSLAYLSHDGLVAAVGEGLKLVHPEDSGLCSACLTGVYPVDLEW
jgi:glutamine phosphoribosylpyrophosphate amidotransferase